MRRGRSPPFHRRSASPLGHVPEAGVAGCGVEDVEAVRREVGVVRIGE